jgi:uncharacterized membrane protein YphA (DoxX/SURF4 family)
MELINDPSGFFRGVNLVHILQCLLLLVLAVLFLQSGWDKVKDFKGNREWMTGHFAKTFLRNMVPFLLVVLTILELAAGAASLLGAVMLVTGGKPSMAQLGALLSLLSLLCLFFGQRIAKDYPGAASLMGYILFAAFTAFLLIA